MVFFVCFGLVGWVGMFGGVFFYQGLEANLSSAVTENIPVGTHGR